MKQKLFSFWPLLGLVTLVNLIQAALTGLLKDEAYYAYFAKNLDWGYFDHPPMVALLALAAKLSWLGTLGPRFLSVLLASVSYYLLYHTLDPKVRNTFPALLFFAVLLSLPLVHFYGFLTLPDSGTLFFSALFFYSYKKHLNGNSLAFITLGVALSGLMYSKYTGILIILATLFSNLKLIRDYKAWMAVLLGLLLFTPHLWWLWEHNWVTVRFHFSERPNHAYEFLPFTGGYIINAIGLFGLLFFDTYKALFNRKSTALNPFERALKWSVWGILLFFFFSSFSKKSQLQWLLPAVYPAFLLLFLQLHTSGEGVRKRVKNLSIISLVLLLTLRVFLSSEQLSPLHLEPHGVARWAKNLEKQEPNTPVIFIDSYQRAALFEFYTGATALSYNTLGYRPNQYDYDSRWNDLNQTQVIAISSKPLENGLRIESPKKGDYFWKTKSYLEQESMQDYQLEPSGKLTGVTNQDGSYFIAYLDQYKRAQEIEPLAIADTTKLSKRQLVKLSHYPYFRIGKASTGLPPKIMHQFAIPVSQ